MAANEAPDLGAGDLGAGDLGAGDLAGGRRSLRRRLRAGFRTAIGDIAFGMEDGAVSIAGLVIGVAAGTNDAHIVLLAGATGAGAGAVSMMAGTYLDVQSVRDRARAVRSAAAARIATDPDRYRRLVEAELRAAGFTASEAAGVGTALSRRPELLLEYEAAVRLRIGTAHAESPAIHAAWMLVADLFAAAVPVIPFALLPLDAARPVALALTGLLLVALGLGRARIAHGNVLATAAQTLLVAAAAALAGIVIGRLVGS